MSALAPPALRARRVRVASPSAAALVTATLAAFAAVTGCGGSTAEPPADSTCGTAPAAAPTAGCTGVATCGAGASNQRRPINCTHCFAGYDSHVCEAGVCRAVDTTPASIRVLMGLSGLGSGAQSVMLAPLHPTMADGTQLTCAKLLSTCAWRDNPAINANVVTQVIAQPGDTLQSVVSVEPGAGRLVFVGLTSEPQGKGTLLAKGCAEGVDVVPAMATTVSIELVAP